MISGLVVSIAIHLVLHFIFYLLSAIYNFCTYLIFITLLAHLSAWSFWIIVWHYFQHKLCIMLCSWYNCLAHLFAHNCALYLTIIMYIVGILWFTCFSIFSYLLCFVLFIYIYILYIICSFIYYYYYYVIGCFWCSFWHHIVVHFLGRFVFVVS